MRKWIALAVTAFGMGVVPMLTQSWSVTAFMTGLFSFGHWLADIGLSSRVARWHWAFISAVLAVGVAWLLLRNGPLSVRLVPQILVIRSGIGMVHFIYSARIWKLSDPQIRAVVGVRSLRLARRATCWPPGGTDQAAFAMAPGVYQAPPRSCSRPARL